MCFYCNVEKCWKVNFKPGSFEQKISDLVWNNEWQGGHPKITNIRTLSRSDPSERASEQFARFCSRLQLSSRKSNEPQGKMSRLVASNNLLQRFLSFPIHWSTVPVIVCPYVLLFAILLLLSCLLILSQWRALVLSYYFYVSYPPPLANKSIHILSFPGSASTQIRK